MYGLVYEMGGSMGTIAHTLELVPSLRAYDEDPISMQDLLCFPTSSAGPSTERCTRQPCNRLVENVHPVGAAVGFVWLFVHCRKLREFRHVRRSHHDAHTRRGNSVFGELGCNCNETKPLCRHGEHGDLLSCFSQI